MKYSARSKLWLPTTGESKRVHFGNFEFWPENGLIHWVNRDTGQYASMIPAKAIHLTKQIAKDILGKDVDSGIARNREQYIEMQSALQQIVDMAKDIMGELADVNAEYNANK